jgi:hypothetical protein
MCLHCSSGMPAFLQVEQLGVRLWSRVLASVSAVGCKQSNCSKPLESEVEVELTSQLSGDGTVELSRDGFEQDNLQLKNVSAPSRMELEFSDRLNVTPIIQDKPKPSIPVQGIAITLYLEY